MSSYVSRRTIVITSDYDATRTDPRPNYVCRFAQGKLRTVTDKRTMPLDLAGLQARRDNHENVSDDEAAALLAGSAEERAAALWELAQSKLRVALDRLCDSIQLTEFSDQASIDLYNQLLPIGDNPWSTITLMRELSLWYARHGNIDDSLAYMEGMYARADGLTYGGFDARARRASAFLHDRQIEEAIESLADAFVPVTALPTDSTRLRVGIVMSLLLDENAPAMVVRAWARGLRERDWDVTLILLSDSTFQRDSDILKSFLAENFQVFIAAGTSQAERVTSVLSYLRSNPVHVAYYANFPVDTSAKLASCIGIARAQVFHNFAYEPFVGKWDFIANGVSLEQETKTLWPGKSRYLSSLVAMAPELDRVEAFDRAKLRIPPGAIMMGTFGRMVKCISAHYILGVTAILQSAPNAYAVLAGPISSEQYDELRGAFQANGVIDRVLILGSRPNDATALIKACDIYCDTYPFPGGQTILDAMHLGVPIVATRKFVDRDLDPSGVGATTAVADALLGEIIELAEPDDPQSYARIGLRYINDTAYRAEIGARLRTTTRARFSYSAHMDQLDALLREAVDAHAHDPS